MVKYLFIFLIIVVPKIGMATCSFQTAKFLAELQNPRSVQGISIEISNSKKWAINGLKLLMDNKKNIDPKRKKKFKATVQVTYPFGICLYQAKVRQSGDWRDHLDYSNGNLYQSLDVDLKDGNIANAVKFKLFLPKTRLGNNEILATLLLRKLDFIAPKTFMVEVKVNDVSGSYLFQERDAKELLEGMKRREGPIFEGDERLIWSFKDFKNFTLESVSGVSLVNGKWAQRGYSSSKMALNAFTDLQRHYVVRALEPGNSHYINPNEQHQGSVAFANYHAITIALGGLHALRTHNRKFYWNALANEFEPIYYDGNISFSALSGLKIFDLNPFETERFRKNIQSSNIEELRKKLNDIKLNDFILEFAALANLPVESASSFVIPKLNQVIKNLDFLSDFATKNQIIQVQEVNYKTAQNKFISRTKNHGLQQEFIEPDRKINPTGFSFDCVKKSACAKFNINAQQLSKLMTDQIYDDRRYIIMPSVEEKNIPPSYSDTEVGHIKVRHSKGAQVDYDAENKKLSLYQSLPDDWFLIKEAKMIDLTISLVGLRPRREDVGVEQRFNELGLTGCLTFYKVTFEQANIESINGACEDSLNIVSSRGNISSISITNGLSDAVDMDFSEISVIQLIINQAGNDCLDVSGGLYSINSAKLTNCTDKGVSVGEASDMRIGNILIDHAAIGASSKDSSELLIDHYSASNVERCLEAFQKKMEFAGGRISIENHNCDNAKIEMDKSSLILLGGKNFEFQN